MFVHNCQDVRCWVCIIYGMGVQFRRHEIWGVIAKFNHNRVKVIFLFVCAFKVFQASLKHSGTRNCYIYSLNASYIYTIKTVPCYFTFKIDKTIKHGVFNFYFRSVVLSDFSYIMQIDVNPNTTLNVWLCRFLHLSWSLGTASPVIDSVREVSGLRHYHWRNREYSGCARQLVIINSCVQTLVEVVKHSATLCRSQPLGFVRVTSLQGCVIG